MAATLTDTVVPASSGGPQHAARVVANLCRILAREAEAGATVARTLSGDLQELLGTEGNLKELVTALDAKLAEGDRAFEVAALPALRRNVEQRLDIAKPDYR